MATRLAVGAGRGRLIAQLLTEMVRGVDVVARYGGEEFLILLPETDDAGADAFAERVREAVAMEHVYALLEKNRQGLAELAANSLTTGTTKLSANALEDFLGQDKDDATRLSDSFTRLEAILNQGMIRE